MLKKTTVPFLVNFDDRFDERPSEGIVTKQKLKFIGPGLTKPQGNLMPVTLPNADVFTNLFEEHKPFSSAEPPMKKE